MAIRDRIKETKKTFFHLLNKLQQFKRDYLLMIKYMQPQLVLFTSKDSRDAIIQELVDLLVKEKKIADPRAFYEAVVEREKLVSTGIGLGLAVPHAKLDEFDDFFIAVAIQTKEGVDWNSLDRQPVKVVFLIGGPSDKQTQYLTLLSQLTAAMKNDKLRQKLLTVKDRQALIDLFQDHFSNDKNYDMT